MPTLAVVLTLVLLAGSAAPLLAQVRYKDSDGITHWVDSLDRVPEQYRAGAVGKPSPPAKPAERNWEKEARDIDKRVDQARAVDEWQSAVRACAASVQSNKDAAFAAYVSGPGQLQMVGTRQGKFWFSKCMTEAGR